MPEPGEVNGWYCSPSPDDKECKADWIMCDACKGDSTEDGTQKNARSVHVLVDMCAERTITIS